MRYLLIIFFALLASCSGQKEANTDSIDIKISKEIKKPKQFSKEKVFKKKMENVRKIQKLGAFVRDA